MEEKNNQLPQNQEEKAEGKENKPIPKMAIILGAVAVALVAIVVVLVVLIGGKDSDGSSNNDNDDNAQDNQNGYTHTHDFGRWETTKEATCTEKGSKDRYCDCGEKQTSSIAMTDHTYGEWSIVKEATSEEEGLKERTCVCGKKESEIIAKLEVRTTVTEAEWKKALSIANYESFTVTGHETGSEDGIDFDFDSEIKYYAGLIYIELDGNSYRGDDHYIRYEATKLDYGFSDLFVESFSCLEYLVSDAESLGYSMFEYSDTDKSYTTIDYGCIYKLWFENGNLVKYSYEENGQFEYLRGTYVFTDANSTERFNVPIEKIKAEYEEIVNAIPQTESFSSYDNNYNEIKHSADDMKAILLSVATDIVLVYEKGTVNGAINTYEIKTESVSSDIDPVRLEMRDGKIWEIFIGASYNNGTYYFPN